MGNIYIDRWDLNGEFYQGGCLLYYEGETMKDYCDRNREPYPVGGGEGFRRNCKRYSTRGIRRG